MQLVAVNVSVALHEDPKWRRGPKDWIEELYGRGPLQTMDELREADNYAGKHVYKMRQVPSNLSLDVYRDRVTLVHVLNSGAEMLMEARIQADVKISHMLVSLARPKTLFDFTFVAHVQKGDVKLAFATQAPSVWFAVFTEENGKALLTVTVSGGSSFPFFWLLCGAAIVAFIYTWNHKSFRSARYASYDEVEPLHDGSEDFFRYPALDTPLSSMTELELMRREDGL